MLSSRFLWQLWGILGAIIIAGTISFGVLTAQQVEADARANIEAAIKLEATIFRQLFIPYLQREEVLSAPAIEQLTAGIPNRVTLINHTGEVLADNRESPANMDNHAGRPEVEAARQSEYGVSERYSNTLDQNMLYVALAVPSLDGTQHLGYVRVAVPLITIEQQLDTLRFKILVSALIFGGVSLLLGFWLAQKVTRPIVEMTEIASDIACGHYDLRLPEGRQDEIGRLSNALNELARGTEARILELTSSRNQLAAVLAGMTEGLIAVDPTQRILHLNDSAMRMLSLSGADPISRPLSEVIAIPEITSAVETCLQERIGVNSSFSNGIENFDLSVLLLRNGNPDRPAGAIVVLRNVTEKLRLDKVRSDFVANASHELKTPISAIRGFVDTILDDSEMPSEVVTGFMQRVQSQARRLDNIVQDLLQLSRFDNHQSKGSFRPIELCKLLEDVYRAEIEAAEMADVRLERELTNAALYVTGEREALQQMVVNLVDNAIKYSGPNGHVIMRLKVLGSLAVIEVSDNGIGIPTEEQERIFERFYRVDRARSRDKGGTGLGLSIVKHIAETHGGSVRVESNPEGGSKFSVRLPLAGQTADHATA